MSEPKADAKEIFMGALECATPEDLASYLGQACAGDAALRTRVEELLSARQEAGSFLGGVWTSATAEMSPLTEAVGTVIGPYKLLQQIGEGGMGVVFMAEQTKPVQRTVALKVIKTGMDTRQVIGRFEAERQALAMMDHPNIARMLDVGTTDTGRPYFVMDLVKGVPITEYCDQQHLPIRARLELMSAVCHAVQHAHQKGIIHRDLKPSNVLVAEYDGKPVPKIIDFGVAKATAQRLTEKTMFTEYGQLIGTFEYMSPEQARFNQLDVDTRSDIYSLGVLLYELLTGSTPLDRERLRSAAFDEILRIISEEEPPRPSTRLSTSATLPSIANNRQSEPARLSREVRGELDWIVMKCLEKDRNRRYETPSALARDIDRYLHDETVQACPPSVSYRLKKFVRRNKIAVAFVWLLIAAVAALTISNVQTRRNERRANTESAKARAISDLLQDMLSSANPDAQKGTEYTVRQLLDNFSAGFGAELGDQPEVEAEIRTTIGRAYWRLGVTDQAEPHLTRALELRRGVFGPDHEKVAESLVHFAWNLAEQSRYAEAEAAARDALRIYGTRGTATPLVIEARWSLQQFLIPLGRLDEAQVVAEGSLTLARDLGGDYPVMANILHDLAETEIRQGHYAEAEQTVREALVIHRRLHGAEHTETAWGLVILGQALYKQQKYADAEAALREALAIFQKRYMGNHRSVDLTSTRLKEVLGARGDKAGLEALVRQKLVKATADADQAMFDAWVKRSQLYMEPRHWKDTVDALAEARRWVNPRNATQREQLVASYDALYHVAFAEQKFDVAETASQDMLELVPDSVDVYLLLGRALVRQGKFDESITAFRKGLKTQRDDPTVYHELGWAYSDLGAYAYAEEMFRQALECNRQPSRKDNPDSARSLMYLAFELLQQDKLTEAEPMFREALATQRKLLPSEHIDVSFSLNGLAQLLAKQNKFADAEAMMREALAIRQHLPGNEAAAMRSLNNLSIILRQQGKLDEAIAACRGAIELQPNDPNGYCSLGEDLAAAEKFDEAISAYREAMRLKPDYACPYSGLAVVLRQKGLLEDAINEHRKAIRLLPIHADHFTEFAATLQQKGHADEEIADVFRAATKLQPDNAAMYSALGMVLRNQGMIVDADDAWRKAFELQPNDADSYNNLAWFLANARETKARDPSRAVQLAEKAIELAPQKGGFWNTLGAARCRAGDYKSAIEALEKSMELRDGGDASDWFFLAMSHWQLGRKDEARSWYDKAVEWTDKDQPKNEELGRFRAEASELLSMSEPTTMTTPATQP